MNAITGNKSPKAEEKTFYEIGNNIFTLNTTSIFKDESKAKYTWTLFKNQNGSWVKVANNVKYGIKVPYTFGEKVVGTQFKIVVFEESSNLFNQVENRLYASLVVIPKHPLRSKELKKPNLLQP